MPARVPTIVPFQELLLGIFWTDGEEGRDVIAQLVQDTDKVVVHSLLDPLHDQDVESFIDFLLGYLFPVNCCHLYHFFVWSMPAISHHRQHLHFTEQQSTKNETWETLDWENVQLDWQEQDN